MRVNYWFVFFVHGVKSCSFGVYDPMQLQQFFMNPFFRLQIDLQLQVDLQQRFFSITNWVATKFFSVASRVVTEIIFI